MKYLNLQNPSKGRALAYEDLDALEKLAIFPQTILRGMGECVIDGCSLDGSGLLNSGVVWLGGRLYDFPGGYLRDNVRNVDNKYLIIQPTFTYDPDRLAAVGGTVPGLRNEIAVLSDTTVSGRPYVKIDQPLQTIRLAHRLQELTRAPGTVEWITTLGNDYTATGQGQGSALGWALCNGQNGTVDLRGRFVLGHNPSNNLNGAFTATSVRDAGGDEQVILSEQQMPSHSHAMDNSGDHQHYTTSHGNRGSGGGGREPYSYNEVDNSKTIYTNFAGSHYHNLQPTGGGQAHPNMPPYYVLAARQWIGL